jgi:hypothetical protein
MSADNDNDIYCAFKRILIGALVATTILYHTPSWAQEASDTHIIYVAPNGNDSWTGRESSPVAHSREGPVKSIERAKERLREIRANGRSATTKYMVVLRGGYYELDRPLVFSSDDSGRAGNSVVYTSFPNEVARIGSGKIIHGWTRRDAAIWAVPYDFSAGQSCPAQLFVNGVRRNRTRIPASGTIRIKAVLDKGDRGADQLYRVIARPGDLPEDLSIGRDTEIVVFDGWTTSRLRVVSYNSESHQLELGGVYAGRGNRKIIIPNLPYFIENVSGTPRTAGTWWCDERARLLFYSPVPSEDMNDAKVVVPRLENLLTIRGDADSDVHSIVFDRIIFEHTSWQLPAGGWAAKQAAIGLPAAIEISNAHSIVISNFAVIHTGANAIGIRARDYDITVENGEIRDVGGTAVSIGLEQSVPIPGTSWSEGEVSRDRVHHVTIKNNLMASLGRVHLEAVGVWVGQADNILIEQNEIRDLYYSGISIGWTWWYAKSLSHNNKVIGNLIHKYGQGVLSDFGGIYTLGRQLNTIISGNVIYDGIAREYGGHGLYADAGSSGITFSDNIVRDVSHGAIHIHTGRDDVFERNYLSQFGEAGILCTGGANDSMAIFRRNIVVSDGAPVLSGFCADSSFKIIDNILWSEDSAPKMVDLRRNSGRPVALSGSVVESNQIRDPLKSGDSRLKFRAGRASEIVFTKDMQDGPSVIP